MSEFKSGFVALVGKPNVGKSTLVNALVGRPISIVSSKPETTRRRVLGVMHGDNYQVVLVDTPGLAKGHTLLSQKLHEMASTEGQEADLVLFMVDTTHYPTEDDRAAAAVFGASPAPKVMLANKVDVHASPEKVLPYLKAYSELGDFQEILTISAQEGIHLDKLKQMLVDSLQPGVPFFPADHVHDLDPRTRVEELIREQVLLATRQEVPHAVAVQVEEMKEGDTPGVTLIRAILYVERPSQRKILIGKKGDMLKRLGMQARPLVEKELGCRVFLELWVKVKENWRDRPDWLRALGYE
jgi:GTP-binding protein Era